MCGKFTQRASWKEVVAFSEPLTVTAEDAVETATPMAMAHIIHLDDAGKRIVTPMRWGFPDMGRQAPDRPKHIHARSETIDTLPTLAEAFAKRRGVLMVETFNEGEELPNGKKKQWVITPKDGKPLAFAVIWQNYTRADGVTLPMFVQATTEANRSITPITDRMPAILQPDDVAAWLGETPASLAEIKVLLRIYDGPPGAWDIQPQPVPGKKPPSRPEPVASKPQGELF